MVFCVIKLGRKKLCCEGPSRFPSHYPLPLKASRHAPHHLRLGLEVNIGMVFVFRGRNVDHRPLNAPLSKVTNILPDTHSASHALKPYTALILAPADNFSTKPYRFLCLSSCEPFFCQIKRESGVLRLRPPDVVVHNIQYDESSTNRVGGFVSPVFLRTRGLARRSLPGSIRHRALLGKAPPIPLHLPVRCKDRPPRRRFHPTLFARPTGLNSLVMVGATTH